MKNNKSGIYVIENLINGKKYVGFGHNAEERMFQTHGECKVLLRALKKYKKEDFKRYVIEFCSEDKLIEREQYWIKELHSHVSEWGYNVSWGGEGFFTGLIHTEESKKLISLAVSGENHPLWGTHQSEESKKKNRESQLGQESKLFGTKHSTSPSEYHGVGIINVDGKYTYWRARTKVNGKDTHISTHKTEIEAAIAYDEYVRKNNLPNPLNFTIEYFI